MDFGILRAVQSLKNHPYVQYVGLGFATLVKTESGGGQDGQPRQRKSKLQLIRLSAAVCGIELCYAAETAFVSPILLKLGVPVSLMTMVWCLSPVLGFFLVPFMGSLSDRCPLALGRRRPFILVMSVGIVLGLALVPNGEAIGLWMGDNGTATLHHPKYFAPINTSKLNIETSKRPGPSVHLSDLDRRNGDAPRGYTDLYAKRQSGLGAFNITSRDESSRLFEFGKSETDVTGVMGNSSGKGGKRERRETIYTEGGEKQYDARERKADQINPDDTPERRQMAPSGDKAPDDTGDNPEKPGDTGDNREKPGASRSHSVFQLSEEHFRGIILTILGVALLDFNCDACQSPCRAYLLDVSIPEDHSAGLTMFTVMAGLGGTVGYVMGGIDWNSTTFGEAFGGHIRVVFTLVIVVFIACVVSTITSFKETPLSELCLSDEQLQRTKKKVGKSKYKKFTNEDSDEEEERAIEKPEKTRYGALTHTDYIPQDKPGFPAKTTGTKPVPDADGDSYASLDGKSQRGVQPDDSDVFPDDGNVLPDYSRTPRDVQNTSRSQEEHKPQENGLHNFIQEHRNYSSSITGLDKDFSLDLGSHAPIEISTDVTLRTYLKSIVHMPRCLWVLCLVNLFCWMSLVCYSLYFTDFVGQAVFLGDPQSPPGSDVHNRYDDGVRLGSFGMSLYSLSCSLYSLVIEKLVRRYRAKRVYVLGQLVFTVGMTIMAAARHKVAVVLLSPTAGIMYATLFTMPYLLVAHYHTSGLFSQGDRKQVRGLGTDVAIVSSMVFLAQFLLSVAMGTIIYAVSSTTTVMIASSVLSFLGALTATQVTYLDL
ncbi:hypothetical protein BaRGS_00025137 [Batillaria attramentaria]|uniref:Uncharacterized protein n=1 Tax=Batillaria attramentaria TaxID=370345 RepID=A0ABD0K907_9CAEN|nr:hypothetical protein BaRGS_005471 [Batillaria attramentaria]